MGQLNMQAVRETLANDETRPRIGLVIGSVGIKSFCALPAIEFLAQHSIPVDMVVAVGGGALRAGLWGSGYDLKEIEKLFSKAVDRRFYTDVSYRAIMDIANLPMGRFNADCGLLKPHGLQKVYRKIFFKQRVEDLKPKTVIAATDIISGRSIMIEEGSLAEAVYASGSAYPLMPPGRMGDRMLVDGSFSSPLPLMECVKRSMDIIIGVYFDDTCNPDPDGFLQCHFNASKVFRKSLLTSQLPLAIDMHHYEIIMLDIPYCGSMEMWEVERLPEILHGGKVAVQEKGERVLEAIAYFSEANRGVREVGPPKYHLEKAPGEAVASPPSPDQISPFRKNLGVVLDDDPAPAPEEKS